MFSHALYSQDVQSVVEQSEDNVIVESKAFTPDPTVSALLSGAIPGAGQIYSRAWWHAPIFILTEGYCIWRAYDANSTADSLWKLRNSLEPESPEYEQTGIEFENSTIQRNTYLWLFAGVKLLDIVDAYVSAHLYKFDEKMTPPLTVDFTTSSNGFQFALNIQF